MTIRSGPGSLEPFAREFLLLLAHLETAPSDAPAHQDFEIEKAKVASYELALRSLLERWESLPPNTAESYRARIEGLGVRVVRECVEAPQEQLLEDEKDHLPGEDAKAPQPRAVPWRRTGAAKMRPVACGEARNNLESEMVDLAEGMKGAAHAFLQTLKKDNERLEGMESAQQRSLDSVTAQSESGRKLLRSGQMSFLCTMMLLAISVIVFCMMIPFIIFT